jgi:hypothetical protein
MSRLGLLVADPLEYIIYLYATMVKGVGEAFRPVSSYRGH